MIQGSGDGEWKGDLQQTWNQNYKSTYTYIRMLSNHMINTLSIARRLSESGIDRKQAEVYAEAIVDAVADAFSQQGKDLATKDFVYNQINIVRGEIKDLRADVNTETGALRVEIESVRGEIESVRVEIESVRVELSDLRGEMNATETRIIRWIIGVGIALGGILVAGISALVSVLV